MSDPQTITAIFRIEGGTSDEGRLDIYDAADTINGLARALNIVTHAYANSDAVRKRADNAHGANTYIHSSTKGCFEEKIDIVFDHKTATKLGPSVLSANYWDYLAMSWSAASGKSYTPTTSRTKRLVEKNPDFPFLIADALESPLQNLHKAIAKDQSVNIYLERPRVGDLINFNVSTLGFVTTREENKNQFTIEGNVTKFNVLSDFGRFFSDHDNRVMSFRLASENKTMQKLALQSMQDFVNNEGGKVELDVTPVLSAQSVIKRYVVHALRKKN